MPTPAKSLPSAVIYCSSHLRQHTLYFPILAFMNSPAQLILVSLSRKICACSPRHRPLGIQPFSSSSASSSPNPTTGSFPGLRTGPEPSRLHDPAQVPLPDQGVHRASQHTNFIPWSAWDDEDDAGGQTEPVSPLHAYLPKVIRWGKSMQGLE